jgi:hypothetical protein
VSSSFKHVYDPTVLQAMFHSPQGAVAKDLMKRGARVESRAKRNVSGIGGSGPKRVDTGHLRSSINHKLVSRAEGLSVRIGTNVYYALFVHNGTGLYGPKHMLIRPKRAKALVWRSQLHGQKSGRFRGYVVVKSTKGMKPNPFLAAALPAFRN